jgi:hypothetical protein
MWERRDAYIVRKFRGVDCSSNLVGPAPTEHVFVLLEIFAWPEPGRSNRAAQRCPIIPGP